MLDKAQLTELFDRFSTPPAGRKLILDARVQAPVRDVKSRGGNVITLLASRKMGGDVEIATESRHIEFAAAVGLEYDNNVHEFYTQPCQLKLELIDEAIGKTHSSTHVPDFLSIRNDGFMLEEWKSDVKLERLAERFPYRYVRSSDGLWRSPQIESQLAELGIRYRIFSDSAMPRRRVENLLYLAHYFGPAAESCPEEALAQLQLALREHGHLTFSELLAPPYEFSADLLNKAIADNLVATDLDSETLTEKRLFNLYRDDVLRDFMVANVKSSGASPLTPFALDIADGTKFLFEGQELTIVMVGEGSVVCNRPDGSSITLTREWLLSAHEKNHITGIENARTQNRGLGSYSKEQLTTALQRQALLESPERPSGVSERSLRRWSARQNVANANGADKVLALVPHCKQRGNRKRRLSDLQLAVMERVIDEHWRTSEAINYKTCYRFLVVASEKEGVKSPSYPTLIQHIQALETNRDVRVRHGKRLAYQQDTFVDVLYYDTPVHGSRPFQYVHIDHTQLDIEVVSSRTGDALGRPWLTVAIDAWSRRILAFYLTFDPPSYISVMMAIRDMVRRFSRLPEFIVVDNGTDFLSDAFKTFLRAMGTHLRFRPAGRPRHGAVLERLFGRLNTEYIHNLAGNTKATKNVRAVSGSHLPKKLAQWTLEALYRGVEYWATEYYDNEPHQALNESPRDAFQRGLRESGLRPQRQVVFNKDFLIATCPPVDRKGTRMVNQQRGVKVDDRFYWSGVFTSPKVAGANIPVRYDPWDASSVYVLVRDHWHHAVCRNLYDLGQLTEAEQKAFSEEFRSRTGTRPTDKGAAQRLREFMRIFTPEGAIAVQFERQAENKALYNSLQMSSVTPVIAPHRFDFDEDTAGSTTSSRRDQKTTTTAPTPPKRPAVLGDSTEFEDF
ncbi:DDE-type integrase/transposase/recombinase [Ralstonia sp. CHL-2022]|uniref:DDE-type integrase/transposase/recombinase n=1 Tax=Ralstonia mojiangensis TaxID=2953895 RepID=A0AAE3LEH2_9RALS|nr:DDE-type integrase/transposase/recombinase [Ralstonia mojiangensis]MCT7317406.1 DDE-type integrase/transposase/recombinase [Ralstonia mojiangensis]